MLEVGRMPSVVEDRTHFGAWCIISAPLILGLDLRDDKEVDRVWDIITNKEAIAVNQASDDSPPSTSLFINSRTLSSPLASVASCLIYADVRTFR